MWNPQGNSIFSTWSCAQQRRAKNMAFVTSLAENTPIFDEDFFDRKRSDLFF